MTTNKPNFLRETGNSSEVLQFFIRQKKCRKP